MKRRGFLKLTLVLSSVALMPKFIYASAQDLSKIIFNKDIFNNSNQMIIVYLSGGPSPLSANLSNLSDINLSSQNNYQAHFGTRYLEKIDYDLWKQAGGEYMKNMLDNDEMTIFRSCYSKSRETVNNKAHGICSGQNMRGNYDLSKPGIVTSLERVMKINSVYSSRLLPFMTLSGKNDFYSNDDFGDGSNPISIDYRLSNPFNRRMTSDIFFTNKEKLDPSYKTKIPKIDGVFDTIAKNENSSAVMNDFLKIREDIDNKISEVYKDRNNGSGEDKYLSIYGYTENDNFHKTLASSIELLDSNQSTKIITVGTAGLGGWDDHSFCRQTYTSRMQNLFKGLEAGMRHLDGLGKKNSISILVFGEFGRNVNLNASFGWDHGNLQNLFVLGGTDYFNHFGGANSIIGETIVDDEGKPKNGRVWLKPKEGTYIVDPMMIASTIYSVNGITNPEELTDGFGVINPNVNGQDFLTL